MKRNGKEGKVVQLQYHNEADARCFAEGYCHTYETYPLVRDEGL